jgi:hypothetical protein
MYEEADINRKDFGQTEDNQRTWNVDLPAGQEVSLRITDSTGAINYSEKVTIREGSSTSCLNGYVQLSSFLCFGAHLCWLGSGRDYAA